MRRGDSVVVGAKIRRTRLHGRPFGRCDTWHGRIAILEVMETMSKDIEKPFDLSGPNPPQATEVTPELLAWALSQFNEEDMLAGIREIRETGGLQLKDLLHEIDLELARRE
jgi:hypothetical protein